MHTDERASSKEQISKRRVDRRWRSIGKHKRVAAFFYPIWAKWFWQKKTFLLRNEKKYIFVYFPSVVSYRNEVLQFKHEKISLSQSCILLSSSNVSNWGNEETKKVTRESSNILILQPTGLPVVSRKQLNKKEWIIISVLLFMHAIFLELTHYKQILAQTSPCQIGTLPATNRSKENGGSLDQPLRPERTATRALSKLIQILLCPFLS